MLLADCEYIYIYSYYLPKRLSFLVVGVCLCVCAFLPSLQMITSCKQDKDCLTMNKEPPATPGLWLASSEKFVRLIERLQKSRSGIGEEVVYDCQKCGFTTRCCSTMTDHICKYHDNDTSIVETSVSKIKSTDNDFPAAQIANTAVSPLHNSSSGGGGGMVGIGLTNNHKESSVDSDGERVEEDDSDESVCEVNMLGSKHECKVCLQEFTRSERVREHYDAIHRNMVYVCSICNYTNRWKRSVIQHLRSKHGKSPPYKPLMIKKRAEGNENGNSKSTSGIPSSLSSHQSPSNNDFIPNGSSIGAEEEEEEEEIRDEKMEDDDDFGDDEEELGGNLEDDFDIADNDSDNNRFRPDDIEDDEYADLPEGSLGYRDDSATNNNNKLNQPNGFRSTHQRVVLACRKCGFSHKWRLILNNHLISAHDLKPPFDQYLIRKKIDSSLLEVDAKPRMQRFGNIDSKPMSFMDELNNPSSFGLKEQIRSLENLNSVLRMPFTNTKALPFASPMETQSYPCHRCSKSFDTMRGLKDHCEGMHSDMVWACKMCPFTDKWRPQAVSHLRNKHDCKPPYNDNLIRKRVTNQSPDSSNQPQHYEDMNTSFDHPSTSTCQLSMDNSDDLPLDLAKRDRYSSDEKLSPKDCFIHLPSDHYQCKLCSQNFSSVQGVTEHYEAFHLKMLYYCTLCNRSDIWRSMMTKHLKRKHHVEKPFDNYIKRLEIEPNMQHDHLDPSLPPSKPFIPRSPMPFDLTYPPQNGNTNRTTNRSPLIAKTQTPKIEDNNIGKHYIHVNNQLKCKICWSLFTSLQGFQEHYEAIHLDIIWTCRQCSHSFRWRQQLTKHLKLVHKCEPPFNEHMIKETGSHKLKKPIPEKSPHAAYSRRPSLPKSSRTSRTEPETAVPSASSFNSEQELAASPEQPQACSPESSVPDKSLSLKNYVFLNNQFSCKLCAAVFSSLQGFQEHHEAIHLSIVYACKLCGFENRWRPQVTTHLKRNHACEPPYGDYMYKRKSSKAGSLESASETSSKISEAGDGLAEDESYEMRLQVDVKDEDIESMEEQIEDDEENYLSLHGNDNCQEDDDEQRSQRCEDDDKKMTTSSADRDNGNGGDDFDSEY